MFACRNTKNGHIKPLYIGESKNLRSRIDSHFKGSTRLMNQIRKKRCIGERILLVGVLQPGRGHSENHVKKYTKKLQDILIRKTIEDGHQLLNVQGTIIPTTIIVSEGNRPSNLIPRSLKVEQ
ncbi:MAG: GIY-YIG nuclease family protein [Thermoleophilia bacterium]